MIILITLLTTPSVRAYIFVPFLEMTYTSILPATVTLTLLGLDTKTGALLV